MSVNNGQPANETTFNTAFISRSEDSDTIGKIDLNNAETTDISDAQRVINELADADGVANQAATDPNAKVYSSNNYITDGDDRKVAIGKLDTQVKATDDLIGTHTHDGVGSVQIDAANLSNVNNLFAEFQDSTFDGASGSSDDVSSVFSGEDAGGDSSTEGVITSAPLNIVMLMGKTDGKEIEDSQGRRVFARLTEAAGTWTLTYYINDNGVETAHTLATQDISLLYRKVFNQSNRPTIGANVGVYDSQHAVADIPDASATQAGKVTTGAQTFAGHKTFNDGITIVGASYATLDGVETLTNKTLTAPTTNGGSSDLESFTNASIDSVSKLVVKKDTTANLESYAASSTEGELAFSTDDKTYHGYSESELVALGGGGGGGAVNLYPELGSSEKYKTADWDTGNNADWATGGGSLVGTFEINDTTPLLLKKSYKYSQGASDATNDNLKITINIPDGYQCQLLSFTLRYKYNGAQQLPFKAIDGSGNDLVQNGYLYNTFGKGKEFRLTAFVDSPTVDFGFQFDSYENGLEFEFDAIVVTPDTAQVISASDPVTTFLEEKIQSSNKDSNGDISDLTFTGLTVGTKYRITGQMRLYSGNSTDNVVRFRSGASDTGTLYGGASYALGSGQIVMVNLGIEFVADSTSLYFYHAGGSNIVYGYGTKAGTFVQLRSIDEGFENSYHLVLGEGNLPINEYGAIFDGSAGSSISVVSESRPGTFGVSYTSTGRYTIDYSSLNLTVPPEIQATALAFSPITVNVSAHTTTSANIEIVQSNTSGALDRDFSFSLKKQGDDNKLQPIMVSTEAVPELVAYFHHDFAGAGGTFTSGSYITRTLNTHEGDTSFSSLSANEITLTTGGDYEFDFHVPAFQVNSHRSRLYNVTDAVVEFEGVTAYSTTSGGTTSSDLKGKISITSGKTYRIEHRCETTKSSTGFGNGDTWSSTQRYTSGSIRKVK